LAPIDLIHFHAFFERLVSNQFDSEPSKFHVWCGLTLNDYRRHSSCSTQNVTVILILISAAHNWMHRLGWKNPNSIPANMPQSIHDKHWNWTFQKWKPNWISSKHKSLRKALNNRFCPVLQLPLEISTEIFMHYLQASIYMRTTPFQLGRICHAWRDLVWSNPGLWSTVTVALWDSQRHSNSNCKLLREWLVHSGQQPLTIKLALALSDGMDESDLQLFQLKDVMDVLICCIDRWYIIDFSIRGDFYDAGLIIEDALQKPLPLLTSACFCGIQMSKAVLHSAPQLNQIELSHCVLQKYSFLSPQITRISLRKATLNECLTVLASTPSLIHFKITGNYWYSSQSFGSPDAVLATCLESLLIDNVFDFSDLLNHLTTPRLRDLAISSTTSTFSFSSVISLIMRSSCTLQRLSLSGPGIQGTNLFKCLQMTPSVIELDLSSTSLQDENVLLLGPYPISDLHSSSYLLPQLQLLSYKGQLGIASLDINTMLLARWENGAEGKMAPLKRVHLQIKAGNSTVPALPQYPQLVAEGMYLFVEIIRRGSAKLRGSFMASHHHSHSRIQTPTL
jgi:hypothetical protein